jgi:hypothetical protein
MKLPRFTLRELFLLVVIAAMGCGWWVERNRAITAEAERDNHRQQARWVLDVTTEQGSDWILDDGNVRKYGDDDIQVGYGGNRIDDFKNAQIEELMRENNGLRLRLGESPKVPFGATAPLLPKEIESATNGGAPSSP